MFELIARTILLTRPTTFESSIFNTTLRSSSASREGIEQTHGEVDQGIRTEFAGRIYSMLEIFTSDTSKERPGQAKQRIGAVISLYNLK
jgi:hypothetical protein